jgi:Fe-S-cluster-containing hydrogenase component 2
VKCDFCDGDPQCVAFCYTKAVFFADPDKIHMSKKRDAANKLLESIKQIR